MALERIKPSVQLIDSWGGSEDLVAGMTDVIYRGGRRPQVGFPQERVERRIRSFLRDGHHSVLEFMGASWLLECSRACTHELIRHRVASYWQESQRYVDYGRGGWFRVVAPPGLDVGDAGLSHYLSLERMGGRRQRTRGTRWGTPSRRGSGFK